MPHPSPLTAAVLLGTLACSAQATGPTLEGQWGGLVASLQLQEAGGTLQYQCGAGTIGPGWTLSNTGNFQGVGEHFFGGGPVPAEGHPPHPAAYSGHLAGSRFTLTVTLTDLEQVLGPFQLVRGGPSVQDMCY